MPKATSPKKEDKQLIHQLNELTQALQLERADAINLRRRHEEELAKLRINAKANVVRDLLPVIDNFDRALKHVPKKLLNDPFVKGVEGIVKQFEKTLAEMGVQRIKTVGEHFNPIFHEAIHMEEGNGNEPVITEELQPGYSLNGEIIRHAIVKVKMQ